MPYFIDKGLVVFLLFRAYRQSLSVIQQAALFGRVPSLLPPWFWYGRDEIRRAAIIHDACRQAVFQLPVPGWVFIRRIEYGMRIKFRGRHGQARKVLNVIFATVTLAR